MLPKGWTATELGALATFSSGGTPSKQKPEFWGGEFPWISGKDLKTHYLASSIDTLTFDGFSIAKKAPKGASLILVRGMTLHKEFPVGYTTREVAFNQDLKALIPVKGVDDLYLSYLLVGQAPYIKQLVSTAGHGTGRLDTSSLKEFPVNKPPLPEQHKIASILFTWDSAIETVEKLIDNSRTQKKALMQQLLSGMKRLPGFRDDWKEVYLGDIGVISSAGVDKKVVKDEQEVRLLNFLDVFRREFIYDDELDHRVTAPEAKINKCNVRKGDVFFTPSSEIREELAMSAVAAEDMDGVVYSYHVVRFRPRIELDLKFSAYIFQTDDFKRQAYKAGDGSGQRYVISQSSFRTMRIRVPSFDEQIAIGEILYKNSIEVNLLQKNLAHLKQEKKALMQQLLTGKRRVKVDVPAAKSA